MARHHNVGNDERFDEDEGNAIGLTRAFSPIGDDAFADGDIPTDPFDTRAFAPIEPPRAPEGVEALDDQDYARALSDRPKSRGKHARHADPSQLFDDGYEHEGGSIASAAELEAPSAFNDEPDEVPDYLKKSRRMRKILIGVIVVLVVLLVAGGVLTWQLVQMTQNTATQQAQTITQESRNIEGVDEAKDAPTATAKTTTVPDLVALLGMTQDEAVEALGHGAQVSATREVNEEGNPVKSESRIVLTAESAEKRTGSPTVYAGFDEDGVMVQAGYSAATSALGYGSLSFADAVENERIIEKTLAEAGVVVAEGSVVLPEDKMEYSTYASDGTTLTKEYCSFSGEVDIDGAPHDWSAVLSYDYSTANATGNLADTIRTVYVYVNA